VAAEKTKDETVGQRPLSHSFSKIQKYEQCPFMFKCVSIDRKAQELHPILIAGRVVHDAIRLYWRHCLKNAVSQDFPKWEECAYLALEKESLPTQFYPEVMKMVEDYASGHEIDLGSAVGVEEEIAIRRDGTQCGWTDDDVWFRGVLDYLQIWGDYAKITDYKSGYKTDVDPLQFEIYAWLVNKIYPQVTRFLIEMDFVRFDYQKYFEIHAEDLPVIERKVLTKTSKIEKETKYKPTISEACTWCGCWRWCPAMKPEDVVYQMPDTKDKAASLALEVLKYKKLNSVAKSVLKNYCDKFGNVVSGGQLWHFAVSHSWEVKDVEAFIVKANELGVDIYDCLKVDNSAVKKRMENESLMVELLRETGKRKVSIKFGDKKYVEPKKEEEKEETKEVKNVSNG